MIRLFRPVDILAVVGIIGLSVSAFALEDCVLSFALGAALMGIGRTFEDRWRETRRAIR